MNKFYFLSLLTIVSIELISMEQILEQKNKQLNVKEIETAINKRDINGETQLYKACMQNNYELARILLLCGSEVNLATRDDIPVLNWACWTKNNKIIELLLINGANPNLLFENSPTPLIIACINNDLDMIKILLKYGANPSINNKHWEKLLLKAGLNNNAKIIEILHEYNAKSENKIAMPNLTNNEESLTFEKIVHDLANDIINANAIYPKKSIDLKNGNSSFFENLDLLNTQASKIISALTEFIIMINNSENKEDYEKIIKDDNFTYLKSFLEIDVDATLKVIQSKLKQSRFNDTNSVYKLAIFFLTVLERDSEKINFYLSALGNINFKDNDGCSVLFDVCEKGYKEILNIFIRNDADINLRSNYGGTALMRATISGQEEIVKILLIHGVDIDLVDDLGFDAEFYANDYGQREIEEMFVKHKKAIKRLQH